MNYKKCPVYVHSQTYLDNDNNRHVISADELVQLTKSGRNSILLTFDSKPTFDNGFEIEFQPQRDLIGETLINNNAEAKNPCHYVSANSNNGGYSTLNACHSKEISGLIRINGRQFILGHSDGNFHLFVENANDCDLNDKPRRKRAASKDGPFRLPEYYPEYIDKLKRWVELVFIADNTIYKKYNNDEQRIHDRLHSIASTANSLYAPLNIRITLVWADTWRAENPIEVTEDADKTLRDFLVYRKSLLGEHPHDNAHLLTDIRFGSVIGKAYKGTMCSYDYSGAVIVDHSENPVFVGMTVAHEMGHNFGMDHDVDPCKCPVDSCIMAPASNNQNTTSFFSDCSLDTLSSALHRGMDYCLYNIPKMAFGGAKCGNGILEDGEDCDCGSVTACPNKCCIASECKLAKEAQCAEGDCCDLNICKIREMAHVCRQSQSSCDLAEFCDGENPSCPADFFVQDGHKCTDDNENYCYQGLCGSRTKQCQFIWGPTAGNSVPECYAYNEYGSFSGNCGYNQANDQYLRCKPGDVTCGRLQCVHDSEKPIFGDPSTVYTAHNAVRTKQGKEETCRVVRTTLTGTGNRKPDPGMVPDGAKCGENRICVNASCRNKTEVLQMVSKCEPTNCNNKGICNNVGNCHCINGYGGVGCDLPGYGGSVNSGPANENVFNPGVTLLYLLILIVFIFSIASIYCRRKKGFWIHKKIWSKLRVLLEIRSFQLVPTRRAPPPPGTQIHHPHRQSWNAVWDEHSAPAVHGEILQVDASRPYALGGARAFLKQVTKPVDDHHGHQQRKPNGAFEMNLERKGPNILKPAEDKKKQPQAPIWPNKKMAADEQRALVMGYDTGKSSSSDESQHNPPPPPPPVPPHKNLNKKTLKNPPPMPSSKPQPTKKPKIGAFAAETTTQKATASADDNNNQQAGNSAKIDVKALAARFEKK